MNAHTQNHRCVPITSELLCTTNADGDVLGEFDNVVCDTYEFDLVDNHGFYVNEESTFEQLDSNKITSQAIQTEDVFVKNIYTNKKDLTFKCDIGTVTKKNVS